MGNSSSMLTQYDIEEVHTHIGGKFSHREIAALYERFCVLDRNSKGYISGDEFMKIPEFVLNPLAQRLLPMVESVNFMDFVSFLSSFSPKATSEDRAKLIFRLYDVEGKGTVTAQNIIAVLSDLSGAYLSDVDREDIVRRALEESGYSFDCSLSFSDFCTILESSAKLQVDIPSE